MGCQIYPNVDKDLWTCQDSPHETMLACIYGTLACPEVLCRTHLALSRGAYARAGTNVWARPFSRFVPRYFLVARFPLLRLFPAFFVPSIEIDSWQSYWLR